MKAEREISLSLRKAECTVKMNDINDNQNSLTQSLLCGCARENKVQRMNKLVI